MMLTPEMSMHIQNQIGADIMMALDDVVSSTITGPRVEEAMHSKPLFFFLKKLLAMAKNAPLCYCVSMQERSDGLIDV